MRNMLTGDNPARAGEDSYGKSEAIMTPPKGIGPLLKLIIPGLSEPPVRTLRATIPENESHIFR